jgi:PadR family transcriptional regulator PadR
MQEATFLILTALAGGAQHGYGIIADIEQISEQRVRLKAGTLYAALDSRLRRYYRLTVRGSTTLADEAQRLGANVQTALSRLQVTGRMAT